MENSKRLATQKFSVELKRAKKNGGRISKKFFLQNQVNSELKAE